MRRLTSGVHTEIYFWGCNPSFVVTSEGVVGIDTPQQPIDAVRWRERIAEHGTLRFIVNTEAHPDHILGNAYFPGVEMVAQEGIRARYDSVMQNVSQPASREEMERTDPDSVWLLGHPGYPPNPPTTTFEDELTFSLGSHTFHCVHLPGHTAEQTAVHVPEERVLLTGDNIFCRSKTFIQEADPWQWLEALNWIEQLDVDVIVPGHGEPCDWGYVPEQRRILLDWLHAAESLVDNGLSEEEAVAHAGDMAEIDPYPLGQRLFSTFGHLDELNVRNLFRQIRKHREEGL